MIRRYALLIIVPVVVYCVAFVVAGKGVFDLSLSGMLARLSEDKLMPLRGGAEGGTAAQLLAVLFGISYAAIVRLAWICLTSSSSRFHDAWIRSQCWAAGWAVKAYLMLVIESIATSVFGAVLGDELLGAVGGATVFLLVVWVAIRQATLDDSTVTLLPKNVSTNTVSLIAACLVTASATAALVVSVVAVMASTTTFTSNGMALLLIFGPLANFTAAAMFYRQRGVDGN